MKPEIITYKEVTELGFTTTHVDDPVYVKETGLNYRIVHKQLSKRISIYWNQETRTCEIVRIDKPRTGNVKGRMPIYNIGHLTEVINFYEALKDA